MRVIQVPTLGFGQTTANAPLLTNPFEVCNALDTWLGTCLPGTGPSTGPETPMQCNWFENLWYGPEFCANVQNVPGPLATLPGPAIISIDPTTGGVTPATPQQQQQLNLAAIQAQAQANQNNSVDCTQWYNQLFNAQCQCTYCSSVFTYAGLALAALLIIRVLK